LLEPNSEQSASLKQQHFL
jgi:Cdc6-like AAA superfamily ATPase